MNKKKYRLAFSPCPNDTFIFNALVNGHIDTQGLEFEVIMADVEELNRMALAGRTDVSKLSYNAYGLANRDYILLDSGSALGRGCGPLLVSRTGNLPSTQNNPLVAIPGKHTTAMLLLAFAFPQLTNLREMNFALIEEAVAKAEVDAGLIIHESRFTYQRNGLMKIADLGELWEQKTSNPIPLGGIAAKRNIAAQDLKTINSLIAQSLQWAWQHPEEGQDYIACHAAEMDTDVMKQHIALYVNEFSLNLGPQGKQAVRHLLEHGQKNKIFILNDLPLFVSELN